MKVGLASLVPLVLACLVASARADASSPPELDDDPACVMKRTGDLCAMPDGSGGLCAKSTCAAGRVCLRCARAPINSPGSGVYTLLIVIGALVAAGGLVFAFRLRRHWK